MLKNIFLSEKKVTKCNFKSKAQAHEKMFLSNEMNSFFAMQKTDFHVFELFAEKVILELKCTK